MFHSCLIFQKYCKIATIFVTSKGRAGSESPRWSRRPSRLGLSSCFFTGPEPLRLLLRAPSSFGELPLPRPTRRVPRQSANQAIFSPRMWARGHWTGGPRCARHTPSPGRLWSGVQKRTKTAEQGPCTASLKLPWLPSKGQQSTVVPLGESLWTSNKFILGSS